MLGRFTSRSHNRFMIPVDIEALIFGVAPAVLVFSPWAPRFPRPLLLAVALSLIGYFLSSIAFRSGDVSGLQYMFLLLGLPFYAVALSQVRLVRRKLPFAGLLLLTGGGATAVTCIATAPVLYWLAEHTGSTFDMLGLLLLRSLTVLFVVLCLAAYISIAHKSSRASANAA